MNKIFIVAGLYSVGVLFYFYKKNKEIRNEVKEELVLSLNTVYNAYAEKSFKDLDEIVAQQHPPRERKELFFLFF